MKFKCFILLLAVACAGALAQAQTDSDKAERQKFYDAIMNVYNQKLANDPGNIADRFGRANEFYNYGQIDQALADLNIVLAAPQDKANKELLNDAYVLRAKIYDAKGDFASEQADLAKALALNPSDARAADLTAKVALKLGDLNTAENNFKAILRISPQNYDALNGLAQVEVARGHADQALQYADNAVRLFPATAQVYLNRAHVKNQLGKYQDAAQDLIEAYTVANDDETRMCRDSIMRMSDVRYDAVVTALQSAIDKTPNAIALYLYRYIIAMNHEHYGQALKSLKAIIGNRMLDDADLYFDAAQCQFHMTLYDDAIENVNLALARDSKYGDAYALKALAQFYQGRGKNYAAAFATLTQGAAASPESPAIPLTRAKLLAAQGNDKEALSALNTALTLDPVNGEALILHAVLSKKAKHTDVVVADLDKVVAEKDADYLGFALYLQGKADEARTWAAQLAQNGMKPGGYACAMAAKLMAFMGDEHQAIDYMQTALANGYGSLWECRANDLPFANLKALRGNATFTNLVQQSQTNFQER